MSKQAATTTKDTTERDKTMLKKKRAAISARVSSDEQVEDTYGLPEQLAVCYEYVLKQGYEIVGDRWADLTSGLEIVTDDDGQSWRFVDPQKAEKANARIENIKPIRAYVDDYTGKRVSRPGMDALRDFVEREGLDVLVIRDTQRFARTRYVAGYLKNWFRRFGVAIEYATQDFADNAAGKAQEGMHEVFDEWQAEELREKSIRGRRRKAVSGEVVLSTNPPYGYVLINEPKAARLVVDNEAKHIVLLIFDWFVYGDETGKPLTLAGIAKRLTAMRVPTSWDKLGRKKKSDYGVWSPSSVRTILKNTVYIGKWFYGKRRRVTERVKEMPDGRRAVVEVESSEAVPSEHWIEVIAPAILEGEEGERLFYAAQERLIENKKKARRNCKREYLLRGMLTCACGSTMTGTPAPQGDYAYYRCIRHQWEKSNAGRKRCRSKMIRADWADEAVWIEIKGKLLNLDNLIEALRVRQAEAERVLEPLKDQLRYVESELTRTKARIERAMNLYMDGRYPKEWLDEQMDKEQRRVDELERSKHDLQGRVNAGRISNADIETVEAFQAKVSNGLENAPFEERRTLLEVLRVQGVVKEMDGEQRIEGSWLIPGDDLIVTVNSTPHYAPYL
jgi:site-specific DNA recombinase